MNARAARRWVGRRWAVSVALLAAGAVLAGCASSGGSSSNGSSSSSSSSGGTYKIGEVLALTGFGAPFSPEVEQGISAVVSTINAANSAGRKIVVVKADDGSSPTTASNACKQLVDQQHVDAIVGYEADPVALACNQSALQAGIPYLEVGGANGGDVCQSNMFWLGLTNSQEANLSAALAIKYFKKIYMFGSTATSTTLSFNDFAAAFKKDGGQIIGSSTEPTGTTNFSADIAKIVAAKPEAVYEQTLGADDVTFAKQFAAYPGANQIPRIDPSITSGTVKAMGAGATGIYSVLQYIPEMNTPVGKVYSAAVTKQNGSSALIGPGGATAWAGMNMLAKILKTKGTSPNTVIAALAKGSIVGPMGPLTVSDHYATMNVAGLRVTSSGGFSQITTLASGPPNPSCKF